MSEKTKISWCDSTVNFWSGCTKVSPGCTHCYAEELAGRFPTFGGWGKGAPRRLHESAFKLAHRLNRKPWVCDLCGWGHAETPKPGHCHRPPTAKGVYCHSHSFHRRRVFSLSLGDWLDPEVPVEWLARMLDVIRQCPDMDWLLVTKRPELWEEQINKALMWLIGHARHHHDEAATAAWLSFWKCGEQVPQNIWVIASAEDQKRADERIPALLKIPAAIRGLSLEPLLGPIKIPFRCERGPLVMRPSSGDSYVDQWSRRSPIELKVKQPLDWVIVGGESGRNARPCNVDWVRGIVSQCKNADVPCFVKQLGSVPGTSAPPELKTDITVAMHLDDAKGGDPSEWPEDLRVREWPK